MSEAHSIDLLSDEAFGWYLSGLTDGEGTFLFCRQWPKMGHRPSWQIRFDLVIRDDEAPSIRAIARRMKCGKVHIRRITEAQKVIAPNSKGRIGWWVFRRDELATVIVPQFDRFPLQLKKHRDFLVWREAALRLYEYSCRRGRGPNWVISDEEDRHLEKLASNLLLARQYRAQDAPTLSLPRAERCLPGME